MRDYIGSVIGIHTPCKDLLDSRLLLYGMHLLDTISKNQVVSNLHTSFHEGRFHQTSALNTKPLHPKTLNPTPEDPKPLHLKALHPKKV